MKRIILGLTGLALFLAACGDSEDTDMIASSSSAVRMQKLDLGNAKYLSLTGKPTRSQADGDEGAGLFKIDEQGNVSAVVLSCVVGEDGTVAHVRNDIQVIPQYLFSLSGAYTLMMECDFKTADGYYFDMLSCYEPGMHGPFNMLVRNSDGKIFYIPQSAGKYFQVPQISGTALDNKGNLYILPYTGYNGADLLAVTPQGDDLVIKQVNPNNIRIEGETIWPLDNGTVVVDDYGGGYTFLYPNGGFEQTTLYDKGPIFLSKLESGIKAVQLEERDGTPKREYIVTLHDYNVGTSLGNNTLSAPIASISSGTDYSTVFGDANYLDWVFKVNGNYREWISSVYETADSYLLGSCLVVDKRTNQITALDRELSNNVIIPTPENTYKGLAWAVSEEGASWFNAETLEYGFVEFDLSQEGPFQQTGSSTHIPSGKMTITGVRNADGKQLVCIVDIETGSAVFSVNDSDRPIIVLVPLN